MKKSVIIFGNGISVDGSLPESTISCLKSAYNLLISNEQLGTVILCGRWSYKLDYEPPVTEGRAMSRILIELGIDESRIRIEDKSFTTVSNACLAKEHFVLPDEVRELSLVAANPINTRALFNLTYVMGPEIKCSLVTADFQYEPAKLKELVATEKQKLLDAKAFLGRFQQGDHRAILTASTQDLSMNYLPNQTL